MAVKIVFLVLGLFLLSLSCTCNLIDPINHPAMLSHAVMCGGNDNADQSEMLAKSVFEIQQQLPPPGCHPPKSFNICIGPSEAPFNYDMSGYSLVPGTYVYMKFITPVGGRFALNLINGPNVLIHVNPRYSNSMFVLNRRINGAWQTEVHPSGYPWSGTDITTLLLEIMDSNYAIYANGVHLVDYPYTATTAPMHTSILQIGVCCGITNLDVLTIAVGPKDQPAS